LPAVVDEAAAVALSAALVREDRIQVPIGGWPVPAARGDGSAPQVLVRISAQRYNEPLDFERLATVLARRVGAG
jgi:hypothetical protein